MLLNNWSYSRYGTWKKCPALLKFQAEHVGEREQHPAATRGQDMHKNIENFLLGTGELMDELAYYRPFLITLRENGAEPELPLAVLSDWTPCAFDDERRWWRGVLDCVVENGDTGSIIFDWKTGGEYGDHKDQREIYAAAYDSHHHREYYKVIHVYLDKKMNAVSNYRPDDLPAVRTKWEQNIEAMFRDKTLAPNPGFYCRFCQFRRDNGGPCKF